MIEKMKRLWRRLFPVRIEYVYIRDDEWMVPLVHERTRNQFQTAAEGTKCDGWYVPNFMLMRIMDALQKRHQDELPYIVGKSLASFAKTFLENQMAE